VRFIADVTGYRHRLAPGLLHQPGGLAGVVLFLGQVGDEHVGPLACERDGHRPADAGVATGNDGALAGQPAAAAIAVLAVIRLVVHLSRGARVRDLLAVLLLGVAELALRVLLAVLVF
jgi:hypothetical protein